MIDLPFINHYLFQALQAGPRLFERALAGLTPDETDRRPDPGRFTIREVMAHLADWEDIFSQRIIRTRNEDRPVITGIDEGRRALDQDYASTDPAEQFQLFRARRENTIDFLQSLSAEDWQRTCTRPEFGPVTIEAQAILLPLHDNYHLLQIAEWRAL